MTIRQKACWTFLLGAPIVFALICYSCSCSKASGADLPPVPSVFVPTNSVVLTWGPPTDSVVVGYKVYQGINSRNYTNSVNCGNVTNWNLPVASRQVTNYFAVTDYDTNGIESDYSNEAVEAAILPVPTYGLVFLQATANGADWYDLTPTPYLRLTNGAGGPLNEQLFRSRTEITTNWR